MTANIQHPVALSAAVVLATLTATATETGATSEFSVPRQVTKP
jgi:hypothetical protein